MVHIVSDMVVPKYKFTAKKLELIFESLFSLKKMLIENLPQIKLDTPGISAMNAWEILELYQLNIDLSSKLIEQYTKNDMPFYDNANLKSLKNALDGFKLEDGVFKEEWDTILKKSRRVAISIGKMLIELQEELNNFLLLSESETLSKTPVQVSASKPSQVPVTLFGHSGNLLNAAVAVSSTSMESTL